VVKILEDEMEKASEEIDGLTSVPEVMSILSFDVDAVMVRIAVQCPVGQHWRIERDLRTRVKARFDREGIQMPHYQKVIIK
jgi:small conductance mechanosensitive channel